MISKIVATSSTLLMGIAITASCANAQAEQEETPVPVSDAEKAAYSVGYGIGKQIHDQGANLPEAQLLAGLKAGLAGAELPLSKEDLAAAQQRHQQLEMQRLNSERQEEAVKQRAEGAAFLEDNGKRDGVVTLAPGLQYQVLVAGDGPKPNATDRVTVHYRGTLLDGTQFDSSYDRNQPATFPLNQVVRGWTEALSQMPVGSKWKLWLGADMGYGDNPRPGGGIPPGATLVFEVELLEIVN